MKKAISILLMIAVYTVSSYAQEPLVNKIRERYTSIQKEIEEDLMHPIVLTFNINRPAIGMQTTNIKFYWNNMSSESYGEDAQGNTAYLIERNLSMIIIEYNVAASAFYHFEYVFDVSGNLIFYFQKSIETSIDEKRLYFNEGKLIKEINRTYVKTDENTNGTMTNEKITVTSFSSDSNELAKNAGKKATTYKKYFQSLFEIESLH